MQPTSSGLRARLESAPAWAFTLYAGFAAFGAYFCMYAYRKAFAAGRFAVLIEVPWLGAIDLKTALVVGQVVGYALSKLAGIKLVSELATHRRATALLACIVLAELALVLLAVAPTSFAPLVMLLNGLPLGLVWGIVFGFVEGRRASDAIAAMLCASFIVASGAVKSVGKLLLDAGIAETAMPALVGAAFFPALLLFTWMLAALPPPSAEDEAARTRRAPMDASARRAFFAANAPGLVALVVVYVALTALRDLRDNFARELWDALGYADTPSILGIAEIPVAVVSLGTLALFARVRSNRRALAWLHGVMAGGVLFAAGASLAFRLGWIGPTAWMIALGTGLYVAYVPYNGVLFDRLVGALHSVATAGFLIYVCDAAGYLGSVALTSYKATGQAALPWVDFVSAAAIVTGLAGALLLAGAGVWLHRRTRPRDPKSSLAPTEQAR